MRQLLDKISFVVEMPLHRERQFDGVAEIPCLVKDEIHLFERATLRLGEKKVHEGHPSGIEYGEHEISAPANAEEY